MKPWFEEHPDWLAAELEALDTAGIKYARDEEAFKRGIARLHVEVDVAGLGAVPLTATFPDLYPYFRFEVQAHGLKLGHHQNPFEKNLCLLPRGTDNWDPSDTLASVLTSQFKKLIETASAERIEDVLGQEVQQAEPVSVYYPSNPFSIVIAQSDLTIPSEQQIGELIIGTQTAAPGRPPKEIRGAVLKVLDQRRNALAQADQALARAFSGVEVRGMWVRLDAPLLKPDPMEFLQQILTDHPALRAAPVNPVQGGFVKVWGALFPEEVAHRTLGEGWVFICHFEESLNRINRKLEKLKLPSFKGG